MMGERSNVCRTGVAKSNIAVGRQRVSLHKSLSTHQNCWIKLRALDRYSGTTQASRQNREPRHSSWLCILRNKSLSKARKCNQCWLAGRCSWMLGCDFIHENSAISHQQFSLHCYRISSPTPSSDFRDRRSFLYNRTLFHSPFKGLTRKWNLPKAHPIESESPSRYQESHTTHSGEW